MDTNYEHRLTQVEGLAERNSERLDEVERRQDNLEQLASSVSALAVREERMEGDVKEIKADVKTLTLKPGKRWDSERPGRGGSPRECGRRGAIDR